MPSFDGTLLQNGMQVILEPFSLPATGTITGSQLSIEELFWQTTLKHADYMPYPTQLPFYDEGLDAEAASALEDLDVWNAISPHVNPRIR